METVDPFAKMGWHHDWVDWTDPNLTRDKLSNLFMGTVDPKGHYWKQVIQGWKEMKPVDQMLAHIRLERDTLQVPLRLWAGQSKYGKPYYQHMLTLIKLMFPTTDITPTLADAVKYFCKMFEQGLKILNIIGGQNMSKSAGMARIAFATMYIQPKYTFWTVSNPFDNVAESQIWGDIEDLWSQLCEYWPGNAGEKSTSLFPRGVIYRSKRVEFVPDLPKAGKIVLRNIKNVGKGRGMKARKDAQGEEIGVMGELIDEINLVENMSYLDIIENKSSQDNYAALTAQNYNDPDDLGGKVTEPVNRYGGPSNIEGLDPDHDFGWHSKYYGYTIRFDGLNSPNIKAGRIIYPYLFKEVDKKRLSENGEQSPGYMCQCRSFPVSGVLTNVVLTKSRRDASRHIDPFYALERELGRVSFNDPAFGGRDANLWGWMKWGIGWYKDEQGVQVNDQQLVVIPNYFKAIRMIRDAKFNDYFAELLANAGIRDVKLKDGEPLSYEDQTAIHCLIYNRMHGISAENFGFDFSMVPEIVASHIKFSGLGVVPFNYNKEPVNVFLQGMNKNSEECCKDRITELALMARDLFLTKQLRGGEFINAAGIQLCRRRMVEKKGFYFVEKKADYKARFSNESPDHMDVLLGLTGMIHMKGFKGTMVRVVKDPGGEGKPSLFELLTKRKEFKRTGVKPLKRSNDKRR